MKKSFVFSGSGGQGIMSAGMMLAHAAIDTEKHATFLPEYGPEQRGGSAKCTVIVSDGEIVSPLTKKCDNFVAMNEQAYNKFKDDVKEVRSGFECGLVFDGFDKMQEFDIVEAYIMVEVPR